MAKKGSLPAVHVPMLRKNPTDDKKMANSIVLLLMFILYKTQVMYLVIDHDQKNTRIRLKTLIDLLHTNAKM